MTISALSAGGGTARLVRLPDGEYTPASVAADPKDATKLRLVKETDGDFGTANPASSAATAKSSAGALGALSTLTLGGP